MANVLNFDIAVSKFDLQTRYYIYFLINTFVECKNPLIFPAMGLVVPLMFCKDVFGIKLPITIKKQK